MIFTVPMILFLGSVVFPVSIIMHRIVVLKYVFFKLVGNPFSLCLNKNNTTYM